MSSNSSTKKKTTTVTVDSSKVGSVIGPEGRIVKRIARDAGSGCRIRHQGNGVFLIEAWTNAAMTVAKRWVLQAAGEGKVQKPKPKPKPKAKQETSRGGKSMGLTGAFAALDSSDSDEDEDEDEDEAEAKKPETNKIDTTVLGFVDEGAGKFRRHQDWVNRQKWFGNEVEKGHEVHPSLAMHLKRLENRDRRLQQKPKVVDFSREFPSLGGASAKPRKTWGTDAGLARVISEEAHVERKETVETSAMEDLDGKQTEVSTLSSVIDLPQSGLLSTISRGGKKLAPLTNGMSAEEDFDFEEEGWNTTVLPDGSSWDETQFA